LVGTELVGDVTTFVGEACPLDGCSVAACVALGRSAPADLLVKPGSEHGAVYLRESERA
jgi:hypothetical protein